MYRVSLLLLVLGLSSACGTACTIGMAGNAAPPYSYAPSGAVSPIQPLTHDGAAVCTAWSAGEGVWVTANHCWTEDHRIGIAGVPAGVLAYDEERDVLVLVSDVVAVPLLRGTQPMIGDPVRTLGFPAGFTAPASVFGHVSLLAQTRTGVGMLILNECGGGGMSGGPVLRLGRVVGMLLSGLQHPCLDRAVTVNEIVRVVGTRWKDLG